MPLSRSSDANIFLLWLLAIPQLSFSLHGSNILISVQAIQQNHTDIAKIYAQNAIRKQNEKVNLLRLASRIDAVSSRVQTAITMRQVTGSMANVVRGMDTAMKSMDLEKVGLSLALSLSLYEGNAGCGQELDDSRTWTNRCIDLWCNGQVRVPVRRSGRGDELLRERNLLRHGRGHAARRRRPPDEPGSRRGRRRAGERDAQRGGAGQGGADRSGRGGARGSVEGIAELGESACRAKEGDTRAWLGVGLQGVDGLVYRLGSEGVYVVHFCMALLTRVQVSPGRRP